MFEFIDQLTTNWFNRAYVYTGSFGDFRFRFAVDKSTNTITASTYTHYCFEKASDVENKVITWDEEGVEELKAWLRSQYEMFLSK